MPSIGEFIRNERLRVGMTQENLAGTIGCSKAQLSLMESGQRSVSLERARQIEQALEIADGRVVTALNWDRTPAPIRAEVSASMALTSHLRQALQRGRSIDELYHSGELGVLVEKLGSNIEAPLPVGRQIPVINRVAAGYPREFTDLDYPRAVADEYIACPEITDPDAFAARVVGESMEPQYHEGDIVVFSPAMATSSGSDCFVRMERDNETTFKRVYVEDDGRSIRLQPLNPAFPSQTVDREDVSGIYAAAYVMRRVDCGK